MRFPRLNDGVGDNGRVLRPETAALAARHNSSQPLISLARLRRSGSGAIGFGKSGQQLYGLAQVVLRHGDALGFGVVGAFGLVLCFGDLAS